MAEAMIRRCRPLLGTFVEISVPSQWAWAIDRGFAAIERVHGLMSFHEETSDLAALRRAPSGSAVRLDAETVAVLAAAAEFHRLSDGAFDVTIGKRLVAAGFLPRPPGVDLRRVTETAFNLEILDASHVRCLAPLLIDLGGIAKGYAVDRAAEMLAALGVPSGIVNAGGDLRVIGLSPQTIHLRGADGRIDGVVELADHAMASSSNRHTRRRHRGREVSPHFDKQRRSVLAEEAVTVIAPSCMIADAMTKIVLADPLGSRAVLHQLGTKLVARPSSSLAA